MPPSGGILEYCPLNGFLNSPLLFSFPEIMAIVTSEWACHPLVGLVRGTVEQ